MVDDHWPVTISIRLANPAQDSTSVADIYRRLEIPLTPGALARMRAYLGAHPRHCYGEHRYTAAEFGLDGRQEAALFGDYLAAYAAYLGSD